MREYHPTAELLERFLRGRPSPAEARTVVRHLLTGCPHCRCAIRRLDRTRAGIPLAAVPDLVDLADAPDRR
jgi:hypothetical protein